MPKLHDHGVTFYAAGGASFQKTPFPPEIVKTGDTERFDMASAPKITLPAVWIAGHVMEHEHTVKSFEDELKTLDRLIAEMGGLAEEQFSTAIEAMINRDVDTAMGIKSDKNIDALAHEIDAHRSECLRSANLWRI